MPKFTSTSAPIPRHGIVIIPGKTIDVKNGTKTVSKGGMEENVEFHWGLEKYGRIPKEVAIMEKIRITVNLVFNGKISSSWLFGFRETIIPEGGCSNKSRICARPFVKLLAGGEGVPLKVTFSCRVGLRYAVDKVVPIPEWSPSSIQPNEQVDMPKSWTYWFNQQGLFNVRGNDLFVTMKMKVSYGDPVPNPDLEKPMLPKFSELAVNQISDCLEGLQKEAGFNDIAIVCKDGKEIRANKFILAARCPAMKELITQDLEHGKVDVVKVSDIEQAVMEILVKFWYTGKLSDNWNRPNVLESFAYAIEKFGIEELYPALDSTLGDEDTIPSTIRLLNLAKKLELKTAEEKLIKNLANKAAVLKTTDEFLEVFGNH